MKKAFDQTVRDLKREVNKKVLKVPGIEQKILDATSNEPWGPHGSLLADIAQATRNYHEYQMIMNVIWKRINDTGKNWRHVYKALTVLEYLVAHGSERVIDDIKEHAYQISTLSDFQYIDSSGRDQGNNVRRKSQNLVALVNDKERILEVRQKAAANRDKYRSTFSTRPGSYPSLGGFGDRYDDDRYENRSSREEDRYGNGRERDWGYRDDDRSSRGGDSYGRDGDRYGRYSDERFGRDGYRDDDNRGRRSDDYQYGSRARSLSRDRSYDDDDRSTRSGGGRAADDLPRDERQLDRKLSEQNISAPPSYEEATGDAQGRVQEERNEGEFTSAAAASKARMPSAPTPLENTNQGPSPFVPAGSLPKGTHQDLDHVPAGAPAVTNNNDNNGFDEFDPRGSIPAAPPAASSLEMDLFGSATDSVYSLALVPISMNNTDREVDISENSGLARSSSDGFSQPGENPFGDPPFKATQENIPNQQRSFVPTASFNASISTGGGETLPPATSKIQTASTFDFDGSFGGVSFTPVSDGGQSSFASPVILTSEAPVTQPSSNVSGMFGPKTGSTAFVPPQETQPVGPTHSQGNFFPLSGPTASFASQAPHFSAQAHPVAQVNMQTTTQLNLLSKPSTQTSTTMETTAPASTLTPVKSTSSKEKFEAKSTVWAETLNRGLVNLNISGPKINPHADIGVDFDSINRKDRMKEEKKASAPMSTATMGKAMGSGSGMGRAGASALTAPSNPMMGSGMGMGMGMPGSGGMRMGTMGWGMGMGPTGYGANMSRPMGMGINMGTNLGVPPQRPIGAPPGGSGMPGYGYNPMMGGNYGPQ